MRFLFTFIVLTIAIYMTVFNTLSLILLSQNKNEFTRNQNAKSHIVAQAINARYYDIETIKKDLDFHNELKPILQQNRLVLFDSQMKVVYDSYRLLEGQYFAYENYDKSSEIRITQKSNRLLYNWAEILRDGHSNYKVLLISDIGNIYNRSFNTAKKVSLFLMPFFVLSCFLFYLYIVKALSPIEDIRIGVQEMTRGHYNARIKPRGLNEIQEISRSFNEMGQRLEKINSQQSLFVSNVSHELKTPVASIRILIDYLLNSKENNPEVINEFLNDISDETDRLKNILEDLLYIAKLEKQDLTLNLDTRPLSKAIEDAINSVAVIAKEKDITINYDKSSKIFIEMDFKKMVQVFINLLTNSIKYSDKGKSIDISQKEMQENIVIEFKDNGIGISKEDLPFIFDRFYRVSSSRSRQSGGTGLGLSIVKEVILLHNGQVKMESQINVGSTVKITLPKKYRV